jgi:ArsR family transcriptional regulator
MLQITDFFKILSDETRLRIIMLLVQGDLCVCEMCGVLQLSQPKVSKHLAKMRDKGYVEIKKIEQFVFYSLKLEDPVVSGIITLISENRNAYPQLMEDQTRLGDKENYLNHCNVIQIKKISDL